MGWNGILSRKCMFVYQINMGLLEDLSIWENLKLTRYEISAKEVNVIDVLFL